MSNSVELSKAVVIAEDGAVIAEQAVKNINQTWKFMVKQKDTMPSTSRLLVYYADGTSLFKNYILKDTASGRQLVNQIRETNRGQVAKARREAVKLAEAQAAAMVEAAAEADIDPDSAE